MTTGTSDKDNEEESRKRKTHKKSRNGCANCKLRRVKCGEERPGCQKCTSYGVTCTYGPGNAGEELHLPGEGAFTFLPIPPATAPAPQSELSTKSLSLDGHDSRIDGLAGLERQLHDSPEPYLIAQHDVDLLHFFKEKTVYTIGTAGTVHLYRFLITDMVCEEHTSYLLHVVLALTLMHKRHIDSSNPWNTQPSEKETFHIYHGTALFNNVLRNPIKDEDRDPLWSAAALLGALTIASIDATCPEEAWPLKTDSIEDLDWLRMSDGKKEVWRLVDPLREGSVWAEVLNYNNHQDPEPYSHRVPELDLLYPWLTKIYDFDPHSSENDKNPYHSAVSILTRLLELDCNHKTIMYFLSFLGHMTPAFRDLLHAKDPRALLLLSWWYAKMCQYNAWWQKRRMALEGQAICMWLEKWHGGMSGSCRCWRIRR